MKYVLLYWCYIFLVFYGLVEFKMLYSYVNMYLKFFIVWFLYVLLEKEMEKVIMKEKDVIWYIFVKKGLLL